MKELCTPPPLSSPLKGEEMIKDQLSFQREEIKP